MLRKQKRNKLPTTTLFPGSRTADLCWLLFEPESSKINEFFQVRAPVETLVLMAAVIKSLQLLGGCGLFSSKLEKGTLRFC